MVVCCDSLRCDTQDLLQTESKYTRTKQMLYLYKLYKLEIFNLRVKFGRVAAASELWRSQTGGTAGHSDGINTHRHTEFCSYLRAVRQLEESSELTFGNKNWFHLNSHSSTGLKQ